MKQRAGGGIVETVLGVLEIAVVLGLGSGAAFAAAIGQFVLALMLCAVAIGVFLRFKRGRLRRAKAATK